MNHMNRHTILRVAAGVLLLFVLAAAVSLPVLAEVTYPTPTEYIADDAGILSETTVKFLRETNGKLISEVRAVLAVCTVKTTDGIDIGRYARGVYSNWKLPAGILMLIATEDKTFFLVQSDSVSKVIDNASLETIRDQYIEADFNDGQYDRAVKKAITQLSSLMLKELKPAESASTANTPAAETETTAPAEEKSLGATIVKVLKTLLIIVLILVILFVAVFVVALFNDDVAELLRKTIFRRNNAGQAQNGAYYDERLYGQTDPTRQNRPRQNPQGQNRPQNPRPRQNGQPYYNADGTVRNPQNRPRQNRPQGYGNGNYPAQQQNYQNPQGYQTQQGYQNPQGYQTRQGYQNRANYPVPQNQNRTNPQRAAQTQTRGDYPAADYAEGGETRAYTIPRQNNNR